MADSELTIYRKALQQALQNGLAIMIVPGLLEGPQTVSDLGSIYVRTVSEVAARVNEEQIVAIVRVFKQFTKLVDPSVPYDPTPLEALVDRLQLIVNGNQTGLGPWFQRVTSFTLDVQTQGVEATVLAYQSNLGVGGG